MKNKKVNTKKSLMKTNGALLYEILFRSITMLCVFFISTSIASAQTKDGIPSGLWEVSQITIEKKINDQVGKKVYKTAAEVKEFLPCPQTWEIKDSKTIALGYSDDRKDVIEYTIEDGQLIIVTLGYVFEYQHVADGDTLTLTTTLKYTWNNSEGGVDNIEEKRIITLKKK
jgi:hypothetical protein